MADQTNPKPASQTPAKTDDLAQRVLRATQAYQHFMDVMRELREKERELVHQAIKQVEDEKITELRKKLTKI